jgi:hypothetical protein
MLTFLRLLDEQNGILVPNRNDYLDLASNHSPKLPWSIGQHFSAEEITTLLQRKRLSKFQRGRLDYSCRCNCNNHKELTL